MLHITSGESVSLREAGLDGEVLFWRDALHDGPVPAEGGLREVSQARARYLARALGLDAAKTRRELAARVRKIEEYSRHDEVVLWFEHDLYDQLQLVQILDWFAAREPGRTRLTLVQAGDYLGPMAPAELAEMFPGRRRVTAKQQHLAVRTWAAFRAPDPRGLARLLKADTSAMPYLAASVRRLLEEYPSVETGLSRSERQILEILSAGPRPFAPLFRAYQRRDEPAFLGDVFFLRRLAAMAGCPHPLVREASGSWAIAEDGARVLTGEEDHVRWNGIDRWVGGVHLKTGGTMWRWEAGEGALERES